MSLHIGAGQGDIAPVVLMPGDPLRAKTMAERFLSDVRLVSQVRNVFYYTGAYKGTQLTIGASGMGCPSIGIYSYELYSFYGVNSIIRIGTAGAYSTDLNVFDLINVQAAYSESTFAREAFGYDEEGHPHQGACFGSIRKAALANGRDVRECNIHSSDVFYRAKPGTPELAQRNNCPAVEMEAFALFSTARFLQKNAGTLLTISDVIPTGDQISATEREQSLIPMMELSLESTLLLH